MNKNVMMRFATVVVLCLIVSGVTAVPVSAYSQEKGLNDKIKQAKAWAAEYGIEIRVIAEQHDGNLAATELQQTAETQGLTLVKAKVGKYEIAIPDTTLAKLEAKLASVVTSSGDLSEPNAITDLQVWLTMFGNHVRHEKDITIAPIQVTYATFSNPQTDTTHEFLFLQPINGAGSPVGQALGISTSAFDTQHMTWGEYAKSWWYSKYWGIPGWGWLSIAVAVVVVAIVVFSYPSLFVPIAVAVVDPDIGVRGGWTPIPEEYIKIVEEMEKWSNNL